MKTAFKSYREPNHFNFNLKLLTASQDESDKHSTTSNISHIHSRNEECPSISRARKTGRVALFSCFDIFDKENFQGWDPVSPVRHGVHATNMKLRVTTVELSGLNDEHACTEHDSVQSELASSTSTSTSTSAFNGITSNEIQRNSVLSPETEYKQLQVNVTGTLVGIASVNPSVTPSRIMGTASFCQSPSVLPFSRSLYSGLSSYSQIQPYSPPQLYSRISTAIEVAIEVNSEVAIENNSEVAADIDTARAGSEREKERENKREKGRGRERSLRAWATVPSSLTGIW